MKLETEASNSLCLFSSPERQKAETPANDDDGAKNSPSSVAGRKGGSRGGCCSVVAAVGAGDGCSPSAQVSPRSIPTASSTGAEHGEEITAASKKTSCAALGRGTDRDNNNADTNGESPGRPKNGYGLHNGNHEDDLPGKINNGGCLCLKSTSYCFSSLSCEHFKFIDDDDDDDTDGIGTIRAVVENNTTTSNGDIVLEPCNGIRMVETADSNGTGASTNGHHMRNDSDDGRPVVQVSGDSDFTGKGSDKVNGGSEPSEVVVAAAPTVSGGMCDPHNKKTKKDKKNNATAKIMSNGQKQIKSVLKKARSFEKTSKRGRVTFDEAVILYSDEFEDPQTLNLRSAAEVNCPEVFYMFEPPIEYQDLLPPFEPPAEYRDLPDTNAACPVAGCDKIPDSAAVMETVTETIKSLSESDQNNVAVVTAPEDACHPTKPSSSSSTVEPEDDGPSSSETEAKTAVDCENPDGSDPVVPSNVVDTGSLKEASDQTVISDKKQTDAAEAVNEQLDQWSEHAEESERVFQRFLEAEREFAEDEELNRVIHVLENDLGCDSKDDAFDDNFFKKLIGLLTAAEGDVRAPQQGNEQFFTTTDFTTNEDDLGGRDTEEDDSSQTHSRTLSEADSDCSVSSQDTIIVRLGEEDGICDNQQQQQREQRRHGKLCRQHSESDQSVDAIGSSCTSGEKTTKNNDEQQQQLSNNECLDEVFNELNALTSEAAAAVVTEPQVLQSKETAAKTSPEQASDDSVSQQSVLPTTVTTSMPPRDTPQDADDSTSSDSRSGEVEEEIRLDDIGYDEEDADDYDEECLRGMVRGNSKIRRIIKKNALQCSLFRSIEARRRQQAGYKPPRPKSPPLSQESLVEQLKWLTTVDDSKDAAEISPKFCQKPPDVILSTGSVPLNGALSRCPSSEGEYPGCPVNAYRHPVHYMAQPRHMMATDGKGGTYLVQQHPVGYPVPPHPQRPWLNPVDQRTQMQQHPPYPGARPVMHPMVTAQMMPPGDDRLATASPVPRDYRDWRVIQRVVDSREGVVGYDHQVAGGFRRCPNGPQVYYPRNAQPDAGKTGGGDELEQFVMQGNQRMERIRKRYSVAEEEDDPTFGFARRPSVRGVQNRIQYQPSDQQELGSKQQLIGPVYASVEASATLPGRSRNAPVNRDMSWCRNTNWRPGDQQSQQASPVYCTPGVGMNPSQVTMPVHRASVALSELPGCATLPHPKTHSDARYHSYAENMYSGSQTLPHKRWPATVDPRTYMISTNPGPPQPLPHSMAQQQHQMVRLPPNSGGPPPSLQVPPHTMPGVSSDERGVPEGASSSPKMSSDSLYHGPLPEVMPVGASHKDDGVIYYSMNV